MREIQDESGRSWRVLAVESVVAHGKQGATLGFVPADQPEDRPLLTPVTFNSDEAAGFAIRTMGDKELRRRLSLARTAAGAR